MYKRQGLALDGVESVLDELQREANLATAEDWGLERIAGLLRRRPPASTTKAMREALAALLRISGDNFTLEAVSYTHLGGHQHRGPQAMVHLSGPG